MNKYCKLFVVVVFSCIGVISHVFAEAYRSDNSQTYFHINSSKLTMTSATFVPFFDNGALGWQVDCTKSSADSYLVCTAPPSWYMMGANVTVNFTDKNGEAQVCNFIYYNYYGSRSGTMCINNLKFSAYEASSDFNHDTINIDSSSSRNGEAKTFFHIDHDTKKDGLNGKGKDLTIESALFIPYLTNGTAAKPVECKTTGSHYLICDSSDSMIGANVTVYFTDGNKVKHMCNFIYFNYYNFRMGTVCLNDLEFSGYQNSWHNDTINIGYSVNPKMN